MHDLAHFFGFYKYFFKENVLLFHLTTQCISSFYTNTCIEHFFLISGVLTDSRQRPAAGSRPAGWAAGASTAGRRGRSVDTGRRCPPAAPETGCCRTSPRSRTLCCTLVAERFYCRPESPSASEELRRATWR